MTRPLARRTADVLRPDPGRVLARLFLPGEEPRLPRSRALEIVTRVMAVEEDEVESLVAELFDRFAARHQDYDQTLISNASIVISHVQDGVPLSAARFLLLGAAFTAEYAVEAAAVCNPSAFLHPDQSLLQPGQVRVALSVRGIGEGHLSSISFRSAVIGPGEQWAFSRSNLPITSGTVTRGTWQANHLGAVLADRGPVDELAQAVLRALPDAFGEADLEQVLSELPPDLLSRPGAAATRRLVRELVSSAYTVTFDPRTLLEQRVVMPTAAEESNGMEDARFTRFVGPDGAVEFRATYTAYDGRRIEPRLLTSPDLRTFRARRLAGEAARNKGMALFPRLVRGQHFALCRSDGESTSLAVSPDGIVWRTVRTVHTPTAPWEWLQVGNCGPPIETDAGWLVLTHGVGPMRTYSIGAILLDLDDPTLAVGRLADPLLESDPAEQDGYVPNVVYSCGGLVHDGVLWIPYGIGDSRIEVARVPVAEVLAAMTQQQSAGRHEPASSVSYTRR